METHRQSPKSILKRSPSPKPDTARKGIRFSERNEVIPIPRAGQPEEMNIKSQEIAECLDITLRKLEKALADHKPLREKDGFAKALVEHATKLGLGTEEDIIEKATAQSLRFFHEIQNIKSQVLKFGENFLFVNDFKTFKDDFMYHSGKEGKVFQVALHALFSKISRLFQSGRLQFLKKSDIAFNIFLFVHGIRIQDKVWHNLRIVNAMIGNDLPYFKQEMASAPDLESLLEPDDTFFSLILASLQLKRHPFLQHMLDTLQPENFSMGIVKELLYAGFKYRKNMFIWKKVFEYQFSFVEKASGLDNEDLFLWIPEGECNLTLTTTGKEVIQSGQISIKTFKDGENVLFEMKSSAKERPMERSIFIKKKEGRNKIYRKGSADQFEEISSLEQLHNFERAYGFINDSTKTEAVLMKNLTCIATPNAEKKKMEVASNFFGFDSTKTVASMSSLKHRISYTSSFFKGNFSAISPLWGEVQRPDDLMMKVNNLKASPFACLESFRCAIDDAIENKYTSVVNRVLDTDTPNIELQTYQKFLQVRGLKVFDLTPSVWTMDVKKEIPKEGVNWNYCRKLICLTSVMFPELLGAARIACGLPDSYGIQPNLTNFKLKVDRDDRTEFLLQFRSPVSSKSLADVSNNLVELQNTLRISTLESKEAITIPKFTWKRLREDPDDNNSDTNDQANNQLDRGDEKKSVEEKPMIQIPINREVPQHLKGSSIEGMNRATTATQISENSVSTGLQGGSQSQLNTSQKYSQDSQGNELIKNKFIESR